MNKYMTWEYGFITAITVVLIIIILHLISKYLYGDKKKADTFSFKEDRKMKIQCSNALCKSDRFSLNKPGVITCYNCKRKYYDHGILGIEPYIEPSNFNNPYDIKEGEYAVLDEETLTAQTVRVVRISPKGIFANVTDNEDREAWEVMCCRLSLPVYYITFGQKHSINGIMLRDYWVEIRAHKHQYAQDKAFQLFGSQWANIYAEEQFTSGNGFQYYPKGCLAKYIVNYPVTSHKTSADHGK